MNQNLTLRVMTAYQFLVHLFVNIASALYQPASNQKQMVKMNIRIAFEVC